MREGAAKRAERDRRSGYGEEIAVQEAPGWGEGPEHVDEKVGRDDAEAGSECQGDVGPEPLGAERWHPILRIKIGYGSDGCDEEEGGEQAAGLYLFGQARIVWATTDRGEI